MTSLPNGAAIGVIGAGPAGTFFSLHLLGCLREAGRSARITLFDRRTFDDSGPSGCNMCAGAIGAEMVRKMERLGLPLDPSYGDDVHQLVVNALDQTPESIAMIRQAIDSNQ